MLASTAHHETAGSIGRKIAITVGLALGQAAVAAPPDNPDPALAPWFESLKQPGTGAPCCSIADCRTVEFRQDRDGYEVLIDGRWKVSIPFWLRVPPNRIIDKSTTRRTAAWFASRLRPAFSVSCVRARVNSCRSGLIIFCLAALCQNQTSGRDFLNSGQSLHSHTSLSLQMQICRDGVGGCATPVTATPGRSSPVHSVAKANMT